MHKPIHDSRVVVSGVVHPATALMSVLLVGGMVSVTGWGDGQCHRLGGWSVSQVGGMVSVTGWGDGQCHRLGGWSVSQVGGMVSVTMSPAALSTRDSSALGDCPVAGIKVSCYTITTISTAGARFDFVTCKNSVPVGRVPVGVEEG